jgi:hypothetical protein
MRHGAPHSGRRGEGDPFHTSHLEGHGDPAIQEALKLFAGVEILLGHYAAVRGLNRWKECDAIVTLGDPRPNIDAHLLDLGVLRGEGETANARIRAEAEAELGQAHDRLRVVWRDRPGWALHVGSLLPRRWDPTKIVRRPCAMRGGKMRGGSMTREELHGLLKQSGLSYKAFSLASGCKLDRLKVYLSKSKNGRSISFDHAAGFRAVRPAAPEARESPDLALFAAAVTRVGGEQRAAEILGRSPLYVGLVLDGDRAVDADEQRQLNFRRSVA